MGFADFVISSIWILCSIARNLDWFLGLAGMNSRFDWIESNDFLRPPSSPNPPTPPFLLLRLRRLLPSSSRTLAKLPRAGRIHILKVKFVRMGQIHVQFSAAKIFFWISFNFLWISMNCQTFPLHLCPSLFFILLVRPKNWKALHCCNLLDAKSFLVSCLEFILLLIDHLFSQFFYLDIRNHMVAE